MHLKNINILKKKCDIWKIQLSIAINFLSSKGLDEERVKHSKCDNVEMRINDEEDEVIKELFLSHLSRYQVGLENLMKDSDFVFDCVSYCITNAIKYILNVMDHI